MNIFILSKDPVEAAQMQCDKHAGGKMAVESAQMLSTAHRVLDGIKVKQPSKSGKRMIDQWTVSGNRDSLLYKVVHRNHPCTVWTMQSAENYEWHYQHFIALCEEYTHRYGKVHKTQTLLSDLLAELPKNIPHVARSEFPLAMNSNPECINLANIVESYRNYYMTKQDRFKMAWTNRDIPSWFTKTLVDF